MWISTGFDTRFEASLASSTILELSPRVGRAARTSADRGLEEFRSARARPKAPAITSRPITLAASQRGSLRVLAGFSEGVISDLAIWPFLGLATRAVTAEGSESGSSSGPWTTIGAPAMAVEVADSINLSCRVLIESI